MAAVMQFQVSVSRRAIKHRPLGGGDSIASHLGSSGGHHSAGQAARLQQCLVCASRLSPCMLCMTLARCRLDQTRGVVYHAFAPDQMSPAAHQIRLR